MGIRNADLGVGLLGCGVVGSAVARALPAHAELIARRTGLRPVIREVAVKHPDKGRDVPLSSEEFTTDAWRVATRDDVDVVVEVIGGEDPAFGLIETALSEGKHVVTANKELLARRFDKLDALAWEAGRQLRFEASVMAGTPAIGLLGSLGGDGVRKLQGILNGTTNFCLTRMEETDGLTLDEALEEARSLGYTELDPSADVEGRDSAAKIAILATLAFGRSVTPDDVTVAGIAAVTPADVREAASRGTALRLVAEAWEEHGAVVARVGPRKITREHPLVSVRGPENGLLVEACLAGTIFLRGPGAGGAATASAILSDIAAVAGTL